VFGKQLDLDKIHVPLGLLEYQRRLIILQDEDISSMQRKKGDKRRRQQQQTEKITPISYDDFFQEVLAQQKSPQSQGRRLAIIGEAGSGKTVQLLKVAEWVLNNTDDLPILIPFSEMREKSLREYLTEDWLLAVSKSIEQAPSGWTRDLEKRLNAGQVWLLMDGVDEIARDNPLLILDLVAKDPLLSKARIVLTCRLNHWDKDGWLWSEFDTYKMLDFSYGDNQHSDQVKQFIENWFIDNDGLDKGKKLRNLLDEPGKERIKDLVRNPLRLGLLCFNWEEREKTGILLNVFTKAQLYKLFVEDFYEWKDRQLQEKVLPSESKFPTKRKKLIETLNNALGKLAKEAIDLGSKSLLSYDKLIGPVLVEPVPKDSEFDLFGLISTLGWLNKVEIGSRNNDAYAFFHSSFLEYFAATSINDWDFFLPREHKDRPVRDTENPDNFKRYRNNFKRYRIFEPQWKEVILFWFGREDIPEEEKKEFIKTLLQFQDGCTTHIAGLVPLKGFYEYRAHFMAAAAIAEFKNYKSLERIIDQLINWSCPLFYREINNFSRKAASKFLQETDRETVIAKLRNSVREGKSPRSRLHATINLWRINRDNSFAIREILPIMRQIDKIPENIKDIKDYLKQIDSPHRKTLRGYLGKLTYALFFLMQDEYVSRECVENLVEIDPNIALKEYFNKMRFSPLMEGSLSYILNFKEGTKINDSETIKSIVHRLKAIETYGSGCQAIGENQLTPKNSYIGYVNEIIRRDIVSALDRVSPGDLTTVLELERIVESSQTWETCVIAASSLCKLDPNNLKARTVLEDFLDEAENNLKRALNIGKTNLGDAKSIATTQEIIFLEDFLRDSPWGSWKPFEFSSQANHKVSYLIFAAYSLGKSSKNSPKAYTALENIVYTPNIRKRVCENLRLIQPRRNEHDCIQFRWQSSWLSINCPILDSTKTIPISRGNSNSSPHYFLSSHSPRLVALRALIEISPDDSKNISILFQLLISESNVSIEGEVIPSLISKICMENHEALIKLWDLFRRVIRGNYTRPLKNSPLKGRQLQWRFEKEHNIEIMKIFEHIYSGKYENIDRLVKRFKNIKPDFVRYRQRVFPDGIEITDEDSLLSEWIWRNFRVLDVFILTFALRIRKNRIQGSIAEKSIAIDTLAKLIELTINYAKRYRLILNYGIIAEAVKTLEEIGISSPIVINALLCVIDVQKHKATGIIGIVALGKVGAGNPRAISKLVKIFRTKYDLRREVIESLKKALQENLVAGVTELRWDLMNWRRCGPSSDLMWYCAQNISYPEFYQAWHKPKPLSFPQRLTKLAFWSLLALLLVG
jgi:hypothetical protein